jgi:hypothetical protein
MGSASVSSNQKGDGFSNAAQTRAANAADTSSFTLSRQRENIAALEVGTAGKTLKIEK